MSWFTKEKKENKDSELPKLPEPPKLPELPDLEENFSEKQNLPKLCFDHNLILKDFFNKRY